MEDLVMKLTYDVLSILILVAVTLVIGWLQKKLGVEGMRRVQEELSAKQELALLAVRPWSNFGREGYMAGIRWTRPVRLYLSRRLGLD